MSPEVRKHAQWALNYHREEQAKNEARRLSSPFGSGTRASAQTLCDYHVGAIDALQALLDKYPLETGAKTE